MIRILSRIKSEPWAITSEVMETILEISQRENMSPEAVAQKMGRPLENTYDVEIRDGVAIMPVQGPLFRYANLFTMISGATSYDMLAKDFAAALDNPRVSAIMLNIDSPGGEANGVSEFADQIAAARGKKPIIAYVGGLGASAAYWIASAADEIVVSDTSLLGSIGTVMSVTDSRERDAKAGVKRYEVVSSQSPFKRTDIATDDGRARMQVLVDSLSDVFVSKVASNRGIDNETVLKNYGQGDVLVGQAAVSAGLADRIGSFEGVLAELTGKSGSRSGFMAAAAGGADNRASEEIDMTQTNGAPAADQQPVTLTAAQVAASHPEAAEALRAEGRSAGATAERARVQGILASEEADGRTELAQHLAFSTDTAVEAAVALLSKSAKAAAPKGAGFQSFNNAMRQAGNPDVGADTEPGNEGDALIQTAKQLGLA